MSNGWKENIIKESEDVLFFRGEESRDSEWGTIWGKTDEKKV